MAILDSVVKAVANAVKDSMSSNVGSSSKSSISGSSKEMAQRDTEAIQSAKNRYAEAQAKGDTAGMKQAHADAEFIRSKYGYSGGEDGSQRISIIPESSSGGRGTSTDYGTYQDDLNKLTEAQRQAQIANLKKAKQQALANLDVQEQAIKPMYQNQRNMASASSQQGARSFAEYLANRGLTNSGAAAQGEINRLGALQNTMGNIGIAEANAYRDIANQRTAVENDYVSSLANANAQIDANYYNSLLNYNQAQREKIEALQNQALYQYGQDYQARINELLSQGYSENSMEVLRLKALRGEKIAQQQSAVANNALAYLQMGYSDYQVANALGLQLSDVQDIAQYYKQLNNNTLIQSNMNNQLMQQELINADLSNQYLKKQIANYGLSRSGGGSSSSSSSNSNGLSYTKLNTAVNSMLKNIEESTNEEADTKRQNASKYLLNNAKSVSDIANIANAQGLTVEQIAKAMASMGYDGGSILTVAENMMGQTISDSYAENILKFAGV